MHCLSNPFSEVQEQTFEDFIGKFDPKQKPVEQPVGLTKNQLEKQVDEANRILSGFVPPEERG